MEAGNEISISPTIRLFQLEKIMENLIERKI
jgi:hypothetical protein